MKPLYAGIAFILAVVVLGLVVALGTRGEAEAPSEPHASMTDSSGMAESGNGSTPSDHRVPSVGSMVVGLEQRLAEHPDDGKGWLLLAKSYDFLGRADDAKEAYRKADALGNGDPVLAAKLFGLEPSQ